MTPSREEWAELVEAWRGSRQSARKFAQAHGVSDAALRYWANRLADEEAAKPARPRRASPAPKPAPTLARVVRPGEAPAGRLTVMVGMAAIVVEPGFEGAHLRAVVRALSEGG